MKHLLFILLIVCAGTLKGQQVDVFAKDSSNMAMAYKAICSFVTEKGEKIADKEKHYLFKKSICFIVSSEEGYQLLVVLSKKGEQIIKFKVNGSQPFTQGLCFVEGDEMLISEFPDIVEKIIQKIEDILFD